MSTHLLAVFDQLVKDNTAGLPQDDTVKWTHLTQTQIAQEMAELGTPVSRYIVKSLLMFRGFKKRKLLKMNELNEVEGRNEQFELINSSRDRFLANGLPVLSIDTKKKEMLGNFHRIGSTYSTTGIRVNDHDFLSCSDGQLTPHGIYDVAKNKGFITLGTSKDTSEFVCDNIEKVWVDHLQYEYPDAKYLMLLCDGGGSNSCRHHIFKQDLIKLAKRLELDILVAHYPAYCSKYNPIEHRLFAQISRKWSGLPLKNIQFVKELTDTTSTKTGLIVTTLVNEKDYKTKRQVDDDFQNQKEAKIIFDEKCPKWNYLIRA